MKKQKGHLIKTVKPDSIAEEMGIEPGDRLLEINGETVEDIFDYQYMIEEEYVEVLIAKPSGEEWLLEIDKDYAEDLGVEFESSAPAATSAFSVSSTRCRRECGKHCILKMTIRVFPFCRATM